jgi:hypothetical protein
VCTLPQFIAGLVAHEFHASVRIHLGGEGFARGETAPQPAEANPAGWRRLLALGDHQVGGAKILQFGLKVTFQWMTSILP